MKKLIKTHKALFILPLGLLPFVILIFYILGGGGEPGNLVEEKPQNGANYQLPDANRNITILDKQEAYQQMSESPTNEAVKLNVDTTETLTALELTEHVSSVNVNEVLLAHVKKQEQLSRHAIQNQSDNTSLSQPKETFGKQDFTNPPRAKQTNKRPAQSPKEGSASKAKVQVSNGAMLELDELSELVDAHERLIKQNDSLNRQLRQAQRKSEQKQHPPSSFKVSTKAHIGFEKASTSSNTIKAQVVEDTKVFSGNRVMLRLLNATSIHGRTIPQGTLVYGLCQADNERLQLLITSIPYQDDFLPVSLSAYDLDGIRGLYVPDNVNRKVYKEVAGDVNPSILLPPSDNPLSYMGINAAADLSKTMVKRVKLKRVCLRKNTVLILKNDN